MHASYHQHDCRLLINSLTLRVHISTLFNRIFTFATQNISAMYNDLSLTYITLGEYFQMSKSIRSYLGGAEKQDVRKSFPTACRVTTDWLVLCRKHTDGIFHTQLLLPTLFIRFEDSSFSTVLAIAIQMQPVVQLATV